jgi:hypothetical protein
VRAKAHFVRIPSTGDEAFAVALSMNKSGQSLPPTSGSSAYSAKVEFAVLREEYAPKRSVFRKSGVCGFARRIRAKKERIPQKWSLRFCEKNTRQKGAYSAKVEFAVLREEYAPKHRDAWRKR